MSKIDENKVLDFLADSPEVQKAGMEVADAAIPILGEQAGMGFGAALISRAAPMAQRVANVVRNVPGQPVVRSGKGVQVIDKKEKFGQIIVPDKKGATKGQKISNVVQDELGIDRAKEVAKLVKEYGQDRIRAALSNPKGREATEIKNSPLRNAFLRLFTK